MKTLTYLLPLFCITLSNCSSDSADLDAIDPNETEGPSLEIVVGTTWILSAYIDDSATTNQIIVDDGEFFTLSFIPESETILNQGIVNGSLLCNDYSGTYILSDSTLDFDSIVITTDSCEPNPQSTETVENILFNSDLLITDVLNDSLVLTAGSNYQLIYTPLEP